MAVHTDVPDTVREHPVTGRTEYFGSIRRFTEELTDFATGGQVMLSSAVYGRLQADNGLWYAEHSYVDAMSRSKQTSRSHVDTQKTFIRCALTLLATSASFFKIKLNIFLDTLIQKIFF